MMDPDRRTLEAINRLFEWARYVVYGVVVLLFSLLSFKLRAVRERKRDTRSDEGSGSSP